MIMRDLYVGLLTRVLMGLSSLYAVSVCAVPPGVSQVPGSTPAPRISIVEYTIPTANSSPIAIVAGPDGNLWFTQPAIHQVGRITTAGQVSEFAIAAGAIAAGPDGNVWFAEAAAIGKITPGGLITRYAYSGSKINGIATGPDGNLYFTETGSKIGKITPQGIISEYSTPTFGGVPLGITQGPGGNLSYTAMGCYTCDTTTPDTIGRLTLAGVATEFQVPTPLAIPSEIVLGGDGNLWFTESGCDYCDPRYPGNKVAKITAAGAVTEYVTPTPESAPTGIARADDGSLWFTEYAANQVARITVSGAITEYPIPTANSKPIGIARGSDGNLWFTESGNNRIGKIVVGGNAVATTPALSDKALFALVACLLAAAFYARSRRWLVIGCSGETANKKTLTAFQRLSAFSARARQLR